MWHRQLLNTTEFCATLLLLALLCAQTKAQSAGLTLFWYTDIADLVPGKTPDLTIRPGSTPYGTVDPPISVNEVREAEKAADVIRGSGAPTGSDISKATWDPTLVDPAKVSATRCDGTASGSASNSEIVVASTAKLSYSDALMMVRAQGANYNYDTNMCGTDPCLQYKLLMFSGSTKIACARVHCPDTALPYRVHCLLGPKPGGNPATDKPYIKGTPCQLCPKDRGYCFNNLCVSSDVKDQIQKNEPGAIVTCSAPCLNCGKRMDVGKICSCHCPTGYATALDCSVADSGANPNTLTCGPCERQGTPCRNGGMESPDSNSCTSGCLCPRSFKGRYCEIPSNGFIGGVNVPIVGPNVCMGATCTKAPVDPGKVTKILDDIKATIATEINNFCTKNQQNYIKCCGTGTLPTSGPLDFVSASDVKTYSPAAHDAAGRLITPIYVETRGNNGLCRKTTELPPPVVPVPPDVLTLVINAELPKLVAPCCNSGAGTVAGTVKDNAGGSIATDISVLMMVIG